MGGTGCHCFEQKSLSELNRPGYFLYNGSSYKTILGLCGSGGDTGVALMILGGPFQLRRFYGSVKVCVCLGWITAVGVVNNFSVQSSLLCSLFWLSASNWASSVCFSSALGIVNACVDIMLIPGKFALPCPCSLWNQRCWALCSVDPGEIQCLFFWGGRRADKYL